VGGKTSQGEKVMTKLCEENLNAICNACSENRLGVNATMRAAAPLVSRTQIFQWQLESRKNPDDPRYLHRWPDQDAEPRSFAENFKLAQSIAWAGARLTALDLAAHGQRSEVFMNGERQFEINPEWVKAGRPDDPELCELLGVKKYLEDSEGNLIPASTNTGINAQVLLAVLRAGDAKFKDTSEVTHKVQGGLQVMHRAGAPPAPRRIDDVTPPRVIEQARKPTLDPITDAVFTEIADDAQPAPTPKPSPARAPAPVSAAQSDLRRDLEARAAKLAAGGPANTSPVADGAPRYRTLAERRAAGEKVAPAVSHAHDPDEGIGHGTVKPGGGKVR
jgi:hypothetical protein